MLSQRFPIKVTRKGGGGEEKLNIISAITRYNCTRLNHGLSTIMTRTILCLLPLLISPLTTPFTACLSIPSHNPTFNNTNWSIAVGKGTVLYQQLQSGRFPDKQHSITLEDLMAEKWHFRPEWPPTAETLDFFSPLVVQALRLSVGTASYTVDVTRGAGSFFLVSAVSDLSPSLINRVSPPVHSSALSGDHKLSKVSLHLKKITCHQLTQPFINQELEWNYSPNMTTSTLP